jgi:hypothetical protein
MIRAKTFDFAHQTAPGLKEGTVHYFLFGNQAQ